ncbi:MAG TPA: ABC transporter ATP-binding protein [Chthoniobacterales bacterium]|nr:ABC transporter ATP-binding protein [Chthoniobacterales bacterium]
MPEPLIVLKNLSKRFAKRKAVNRISMSIQPGEIFGFLGANGAGKTTTIRMLCGLTKPSAGTGKIDGLNIWRDRFKIRSQFGYVPQKFSLYADLTVGENIRFFAGAYRVPANKVKDRIRIVMDDMDLGLREKERAGRLSGGYKQLLAMACALMHKPKLLFLDEPTAGLDPTHRQRIWDLLYEFSQAGTTIFVTTHYMDEAERCTEVGFVDDGHLIANGSPRDLKESLAGHLLEVQVEPAMNALFELRKLPEVYGVDLRSGNLRVHAEDPDGLLRSWQNYWPFPKLRFLGFNWVEPDMEDVFQAYSKGYHRRHAEEPESARLVHRS